MKQFNSLVTGGAQGIGKAIVIKLISRGDKVFVFDQLTQSHEAPKAITKLGATYIQVDVSSVESIKMGFEKIFSSSVNPVSLELLVNNAGITADNIALRMSESDWDRVLDVNLKGTFFCSQCALKHMIKLPKSYIINISSIVAIYGNAGQANYSASKAGIIALTKTLAQEYASRNVLVNAIAPGFIQTKMTESIPDAIKTAALQRIALKRFGSPNDITNLVAFLSSGDADYITGQAIEVAGGII